jgi:hypothetical protein
MRDQQDRRRDQDGMGDDPDQPHGELGPQLTEDSEEVDTEELPTAIRSRVKREFRGTDIESANRRETQDGQTIYEVTVEDDEGTQVTRYYYQDGSEYFDTRQRGRQFYPQRHDGIHSPDRQMDDDRDDGRMRQDDDNQRGPSAQTPQGQRPERFNGKWKDEEREQRHLDQQREQQPEQMDQHFRGDAEEIETDDLPQVIQNRVQTEFRDGDIDNVKRRYTQDGEMVYEVTVDDPDRGEVTKYFHSDGREFKGTQKHHDHQQMDRKRDDDRMQQDGQQRGPQAQHGQREQQQRDQQREQMDQQFRGDAEELETDDLPQVIQNRVQTEFRDGDIDNVKRRYTQDGEMVYEVTVDDPDRGEVTKYFHSDGREFKGAQKHHDHQQMDRKRDDDRMKHDDQERGPQAQYGTRHDQQRDQQREQMDQHFRGDAEEIETDDLPQVIQNRVQTEFRNGDIDNVKRRYTQDGEMVYEVTVDDPDRGEVTKYFHSDGREFKGAQKHHDHQQMDRKRDDDRMKHDDQERGPQAQYGTRHDQQRDQQREQMDQHFRGDAEEIETDDLPQVIQNRVQTEFRNGDIDNVKRRYTQDGEMVYEVTVDDPDRGEVTKYYHSDGREFKGTQQRHQQQQMDRQRDRQRDDDRMQQDDQQRGPNTQQPYGDQPGQMQHQQQDQFRDQGEEVDADELPSVIKNRVETQFRNGEIESVRKHHTMQTGEIVYEVTIDDPDRGSEVTRYFREDGRDFLDPDQQRRGEMQPDRRRHDDPQDGFQPGDQNPEPHRDFQHGQRDQQRHQMDNEFRADSEEIESEELPQTIQTRLMRDFRDAEIEKVNRRYTLDGDMVYEVVIDDPQQGEITRYYHLDGREFMGAQQHGKQQREHSPRRDRDDDLIDQPRQGPQAQEPRGGQAQDQRDGQRDQERVRFFDDPFQGADAQEVDSDELPGDVQQEIERNFGEADVDNIRRLNTTDGETIYEVNFDDDNFGEFTKYYHSDGREYKLGGDRHDNGRQRDDQDMQDNGRQDDLDRRDDQQMDTDRRDDQDRRRDDDRFNNENDQRGPQAQQPQDQQQQPQQRGQQQRQQADQQQMMMDQYFRGDAEQIDKDDLPEHIRNRVDREFRDAEIDSVQRRHTHDGEVIYQVVVEDPNRGEVSRFYREDGSEFRLAPAGRQQDQQRHQQDGRRPQDDQQRDQDDWRDQQDQQRHQQDGRHRDQQDQQMYDQHFRDEGVDLNEDDLPQTVRRRVEQEFRDADIDEVKMRYTHDGEMIYQVKIDQDNGDREVKRFYRRDGSPYELTPQRGMQPGQQQQQDRRRDDDRDWRDQQDQQGHQQDGRHRDQQDQQMYDQHFRDEGVDLNEDDLPQTVRRRVEQEFRDADIDEVKMRYTHDGEMIYQVKIDQDNGDREVKRFYRRDGSPYELTPQRGMQPGQQQQQDRRRDDDRDWRDQQDQQRHQQDGRHRDHQDQQMYDQHFRDEGVDLNEDDLPQTVRRRVEQEFRDADIDEVKMRYTHDGEMIYQVKIDQDNGDREVKRFYRRDGSPYELTPQRGMQPGQQQQQDRRRDDDRDWRDQQDQQRDQQDGRHRDQQDQQMYDQHFRDEGVDLNEDDLPQTVRRRVEQEFRDADIDEVKMRYTHDGEMIYQVKIDQDNGDREVKRFYRRDGSPYELTPQRGMQPGQQQQQDRRRDDDRDWRDQQDQQRDQQDGRHRDQQDQQMYDQHFRDEGVDLNEDDLPQTVRRRVEQEFRDADIDEVKMRYTHDGEMIYQVKIDQDNGDREVKRFYRRDGSPYELTPQRGMQPGQQQQQDRRRDDDRYHDNGQHQDGPRQGNPGGPQHHHGQHGDQQDRQRSQQQDQQLYDQHFRDEGVELNEDDLPQPVQRRVEQEFRDADIDEVRMALHP